MKRVWFFLVSLAAAFASDCESVFTDRWGAHAWGGVSLSGTGSDLIQTEEIRKEIPALLRKYRCKTMIDAACGDFYWMRSVDLPVDQYIGIDIVLPLVVTNQIHFADRQRSFIHLNITEEIPPKSDLIFCRDCLVHLSFEDIAQVIENFKQSGSTYLLTTGFTASEHNPAINASIDTGGWRPIDLRQYPFYFPEPLEIINEHCTEGGGVWSDKSLFLWRLSDLP